LNQSHPLADTLTLRVLDGADRGRIYNDLELPITIGREEGNEIQLNDERISRFHVKLQLDHEQVVLTDLESTNGTKVNGEEVQIRILRYGDLISVGRSVLLFGSRDQIADRLQQQRTGDTGSESGGNTDESLASRADLGFELNYDDDREIQAALHVLDPPEMPSRLSPGQAAQLAEVMEFVHARLRSLMNSSTKIDTDTMGLSFRKWQSLLDLQSRVSEYIRRIGEPE
tara:strand:+ start:49 stop:732 length:684 start_codon:yes stop_codon:yes gene_type:complete